MSRVGLKIGLATAVLLLTVVATMGAVNASSITWSVNTANSTLRTVTPTGYLVSGVNYTAVQVNVTGLASNWTKLYITVQGANTELVNYYLINNGTATNVTVQLNASQSNQTTVVIDSTPSASSYQSPSWVLVELWMFPKVTGTINITAKAYNGTTQVNSTTTTLEAKASDTGSPLPESNVQLKYYDTTTGNVIYMVKFSPVSEYRYNEYPKVLQYDLGSKITIDVYNYVPSSDYNTVIELINLDNGLTAKSFSIAKGVSYGQFVIDTAEIGPGNYTLKISVPGTTSPVWNISDPNAPTNAGAHIIYIKAVTPKISIALKNRITPVAMGDIARFDIKVEGYTGAVTVKVKGPFDGSPKVYTLYFDKTNGTEQIFDVNLSDTSTFKNATAGTWEIDVTAGTTTESLKFDVADVSVKAELPSTAYLSQELTFKGTTNLAETSSSYDAADPNYVYIYVFTPSGNLTKWNASSSEWEITSLTTHDVSTSKDVTNYSLKVPIKSDGSWESTVKLKLNLSWETGSYRIDVVARANKIDNDKFRDVETYYINVKKPKIEFKLDKLTFTNGEDIIIKGTATVSTGTIVHITCTNMKNGLADLLKEVRTKEVTVSVSTDGTWKTDKYHIKDDAARTTYTLKAYIVDSNGNEVCSAYTTISVVKATVNATLSRHELVRGADVTLSGHSPIDTLYVYTDDTNVFDNVAKIPNTNKFLYAGNETLVVKTDANGNFKVTLTVSKTADTGTYTLYVIAPSNTSEVDLSRDAYVQIPVTITEVGFVHVPDKIVITRGGQKDVFVEVNAEPDNVVKVEYKLEGHGIDIKASDNTKFSKWNETENGWWVFTTIYTYYDPNSEQLKPSWQEGYKLLTVGTYDFTIKLYKITSTGGWEEETSVSIPLIVQAVELNVTAPTEVKKGDMLVVTVHENRVGEKAYDNVYVILDLGTKIRKYAVTLNENGTATVEIPTADIDPGTYKLYIRDTMGTELHGTIDDYYDIPPTDAYAKYYKADDDALWVGTVKIVEAAAVTTTVPPTTTVTATVTTTTVPTTTTTVAPTTTVAKTTTVVTTPPPTTTKKTPGFEAIFAIAGLLAIAYLLRRRQ